MIDNEAFFHNTRLFKWTCKLFFPEINTQRTEFLLHDSLLVEETVYKYLGSGLPGKVGVVERQCRTALARYTYRGQRNFASVVIGYNRYSDTLYVYRKPRG